MSGRLSGVIEIYSTLDTIATPLVREMGDTPIQQVDMKGAQRGKNQDAREGA